MSCKSLEVIPSPRGAVFQARINPSIRWLPLKQRRHLELFCGYSVRTWRAGKPCFSLYSILSLSLQSPWAWQWNFHVHEVSSVHSMEFVYPASHSLDTGTEGLASCESPLSQRGKAPVWNGKEDRKKKVRKKIRNDNILICILSNCLTLKY